MITPKGVDILTGFVERGKYFKTTLKGDYENSKKAWNVTMDEIEDLLDHTIRKNAEPIEVYVNNILTTPNPADLITEIYIPVKKIRLIDN